MPIIVEKFITGPIETNTYVVSNEEKACLLIDPSKGCDAVLEYMCEEALTLEAVCLTHGHFDHFIGLEEILAAFPGTDVWIHPEDKPLLRDPEYNGAFMIGVTLTYMGPLKEITEGTMSIGSFTMQVFHVPGHSPGGVAFILDNYCFCGDSLFAGSVGRVDFPGCNGAALITSVKEKLLTLPDETVVCPGHMGRTTIGREKKYNPFLQ